MEGKEGEGRIKRKLKNQEMVNKKGFLWDINSLLCCYYTTHGQTLYMCSLWKEGKEGEGKRKG